MGHHNRLQALQYDWNLLAGQLRSEYQEALGARPIRENLPSWSQTAGVDSEPIAERAVSGGLRR